MDNNYLLPSNPNGSLMRGFCSNCYNKRILTYEVFVFFALAPTVVAEPLRCEKWLLSPEDGHNQPSGMIQWSHKAL